MPTFYRLADEQDRTLGVFDRASEALKHAPEVDMWRMVKDGKVGEFDGWRANYSLYDKPHFTIRAVDA